MKKTKTLLRAVALLLCALVCLTFIGCKKNKTNDTSSTGSSATTGLDLSGGFSSGVYFDHLDKVLYTANPTFYFTNLKDGYSVNIKITDEAGNVILDKTGLTGDSYKCEATLKNGADYTVEASFINEKGEQKKIANIDTGGETFVCVAQSSVVNNSAFAFNGSISENVLNNYLDHSVNYALGITSGFKPEEFDEGIRFLLSVGAKYVPRAAGEWYASNGINSFMNDLKFKIDLAHQADPDIIFEAAIFETTTKQINNIAIPDWVFKAFGLPVEQRNFNYDATLFADGSYFNAHGDGVHAPDITTLEHQMFVYYRACQFIDAGFEAFHLGQTLMTGKNDTNDECWTKVVGLIREYAKTHARRGYVIINSHDHGELINSKTGAKLMDFIMAPMRPHAAANDVYHLPSEDNPQRCIIEPGYWGETIYDTEKPGTSPSGWYTANYPYLVEFDNYGDSVPGIIGRPDSYVWGLDEASWYGNQPQWYREEFMKYLINTIDSYNENGHASFNGHRGGYYDVHDKKAYQLYANNPKYYEGGTNDEAWMKKMLTSRKLR